MFISLDKIYEILDKYEIFYLNAISLFKIFHNEWLPLLH